MHTLISVYTGLLVFIGMLMVRNFRVFRCRTSLSNKLYNKHMQEINNGKFKAAESDHQWLYLREVSYDKMMLMFWKPLHSFYDPKFLKYLGVK